MRRFLKAGTALSLVAVAMLLLTSAAPASGCGRALVNYAATYNANGYQATYQQQTYYAQAAYAQVIPVAVHLFQFVETPKTTVTTVTQQTTQASAVTGVSGVIGGGGLNTAAATAPTSLLSDAQVLLLARELARQLKAADDQPQPQPAPPQPRKAEPVPAPMKKEEGKPTGAASGSNDPLARIKLSYQVAALSASRCMECHTQGSEKGKVVLFNDKAQYGPNVDAQKIYEAVREDHMPLKGAKLTDAEKDVYRLLASN